MGHSCQFFLLNWFDRLDGFQNQIMLEHAVVVFYNASTVTKAWVSYSPTKHMVLHEWTTCHWLHMLQRVIQ